MRHSIPCAATVALALALHLQAGAAEPFKTPELGTVYERVCTAAGGQQCRLETADANRKGTAGNSARDWRCEPTLKARKAERAAGIQSRVAVQYTLSSEWQGPHSRRL